MSNKDIICLVGTILFAAFIALLLILFAEAHDYKSHASLDPNERDWFGEQKIPGGANQGNSCCSQADGEFAEEDIRNNRYWVRWPSSHGVWYMVPDEAIIRKPNPHGRAAVWWGGQEYNGSLYIRCFIAGALL